MSRIIFNSGYELEFPHEQWNKVIQDLKTKGLRLQFVEDCMIPMSQSSIERIMKDTPEIMEEGADIPTDMPEVRAMPEKDEDKEPTIDEQREAALQEMIEKSNCKHEPEKLVLHKQVTKAGPRYFHVCNFCGHRGRYEKKMDLLEAGFDLDTAIEWVDKD